MPEYTCYCKKVPEPELNPHWLAHSCGEVCEKDRGCPHPCPELCHPGPCARCTAVGGPGSCHCGREQTATTRCGDPKQWSCGAACGQALSCGQHSCKARCHAGPCPPCTEASEESCYCGKAQEWRRCGHSEFSCHKPSLALDLHPIWMPWILTMPVEKTDTCGTCYPMSIASYKSKCSKKNECGHCGGTWCPSKCVIGAADPFNKCGTAYPTGISSDPFCSGKDACKSCNGEWCRAGYNSHFTIVEDAELSDLPPSLFLRGQAH
eukprot:g5039.t1